MTEPLTLDGGTLLSGERHVLELIATGANLHAVLDALCSVIDEQLGPHHLSSVYLLDRDRKQLRFESGPRVPEVWQEATSVFAATPDAGACGRAINLHEQTIVQDVLTSPLFRRWRDTMRAVGIKTVWSTPFLSTEGDPLGTFAVLCLQPGAPGETQRNVVARATHLASIAVEQHLVATSLRESERRFSSAFYLNPACMTISRRSDGRLLHVNDAFARLFGYSRAEAIGHTVLELGLYADPTDWAHVLQLLADNKVRDVEVRARTKTGELIDVSLSMERIELLGEDTVLAIAADVTERKRANTQLRASEQLLRTVLDTLPVSVVVVDVKGNIILHNPAARRIWGEIISDGRERYVRAKAWWHDTRTELQPSDWGSVRAVRDGEASVNEVVDIEAFDGARKVIRTSAVPIRESDARVTGAVIVNEDVTARIAAERERDASLEQMRALTTRLMRTQEDEHRRIAQVLHETTAQDLAGLKMLLGRLQRTAGSLSDDDRSVLGESVELAERSMAGIRTLSYVLYPPFLDENGLPSALRWYVRGFSERSGIRVDLEVPPLLDRLPRDIEATLFRVVQEALINILRHAHSETAGIRLRAAASQLTLEIEDHGRGMSPELIARIAEGGDGLGVGIAGMRERLAQFGGSMDIQSGTSGTTVRVRVPLSQVA